MLQITTQGTAPFQLAEFRDHVGIGYTDDDPALQRSLDAAVLFWEKATRHYTRTTVFTLDWFSPSSLVPAGGGALSMSQVVRHDPDGTTTETVTDDWMLTRSLGEHLVRLNSSGTCQYGNRYTGTFEVAVTEVDASVRAAVYGLGSHFFMNRDAVGAAATLQQIPFAVRALVGMYQRGSL